MGGRIFPDYQGFSSKEGSVKWQNDPGLGVWPMHRGMPHVGRYPIDTGQNI